MPYVEHLEIEYPLLTNNKMYQPPYRTPLHVRQDFISLFWENLQQRFPRAKRVIFNHNAVRAYHEEHIEPPSIPLALQLLIKACPSSIKASTIVLESQTPTSNATVADRTTSTWYRPVYRFETSTRMWEKSEQDLNHTTVFMPVKQFQGPIGEFKRIWYMWDYKLKLERQGLWPLMVEARDRYHFDGRRHESFPCMLLECDAYFDKPGLWTSHALQHHAQLREDTLLGILPSDLRADFAQRIHDLECRLEALKDDYRRLKAAWNDEDEERRNDLKARWSWQLKHDKAWDMGDGAEASELWPDFSMCV